MSGTLVPVSGASSHMSTALVCVYSTQHARGGPDSSRNVVRRDIRPRPRAAMNAALASHRRTHMKYLMHAKTIELRERLLGEDGATAVEYAIMVALIAIVIIVAVTFLGNQISTTFKTVGDQVPA